jgi:4-diphosphocytidyl-2-C-methyl-D-erythritol kinase
MRPERQATPIRALTVAAPAKVNLFLHVTGQRADGYHLLESLFALIDFADTVTLTLTFDGEIARTNDVAGVPAEDDLAIRAARLLQRATATRAGVAIRIDKRIPLGAGLGGGSSDAASVLLGLNRLWGLKLSRTELASLCVPLGADVPFFVNGENAFVRGIGERVQPVSLPRQWLALAMPATHVSTAHIFTCPELTRSTASAKISVFSESYGRNDLEPVAASRYPQVASALASFARIVPGARMTGSGAAVFAACETPDAARRAVNALPEDLAGRVVTTLARHPLMGFAR